MGAAARCRAQMVIFTATKRCVGRRIARPFDDIVSGCNAPGEIHLYE